MENIGPNTRRVLREFFATITDEELINFLQSYNTTKAITDLFDGPLLSHAAVVAELHRRSDDHLSLFFGI